MNKKGTIIDDKEDLEIKKVANMKPFSKLVFYMLFIMFFSMLCSSIILGNFYFINKRNKNIVEINEKDQTILITNNGFLQKNINKEDFNKKEELKIEQISSIEVKTNEKDIIKFNVVYNILENDFRRNEIASLYSDVLIRFAYSFDNEKWTYINNVISSTESTLSPLMGNYYDISGIKTNLKIITNYNLETQKDKKIKMFWKSELVFKNPDKIKYNNKFNSELKIEHKDNK